MAPDSLLLGPEYRSLPPRSWGKDARSFLASKPRLDEFQTPLLTLDSGALEHNVRVMADWVSSRGLELAPHGKTTMAPQLWQALLDAGAWGITVATPWQAQVARSHGVKRIILANQLVDPVALRWLADTLHESQRQGEPLDFVCWVDSLDGVTLMEDVLAASQPAVARGAVAEDVASSVGVIVELGAAGARTGTRTVAEAVAVAAAVEQSEYLTLRGVGGYEGAITSERTPAALEALEHYLDALVQLHDAIDWGERRPIVTAGGSAYFELVAATLGTLSDRATVILRSGAYQVHDDGFYLGISPFAEGGEGYEAGEAGDTPSFRSAMHGWARVLSCPEPGLVLLDGGKRDFPADLGFPTAQLVVGFSDADSARVLAGSEIVKFADQHAFLQLAEGQTLPVGAVVRLGLSHPCTAFDKWRLIPVIADSSSAAFAAGAGSTVTDLIRTYF